jgi:hypothetical protein
MRFLSHLARDTTDVRRVLALDNLTSQTEKTNIIAARVCMEIFVDRRVVPVIEK